MVAVETGILLNTRGCYFYLDPENPNALAPRKRPRTTPHAFFIKKDGKPFMTLATPGMDNQPQSNLQVFFNIVEFGMNVQDAVSAPRFQTSSFPGSPWPHASVPGNLTLEGRISENVGKTLAARGHKVMVTTDWGVKNGFVPIMVNPETGVFAGGADPRRECYMIGW
jgi:gamma-glutamyltranspeptidase/glutathione hydrolase